MTTRLSASRALRLTALCLGICFLLSLFSGCNMQLHQKKETESTAPAVTLDPEIDYEGLTTRSVYTVADLSTEDPRLDVVVASVGDRTLTNRQLQIYFYIQVFSYVGQMNQAAAQGYDVSGLGLDMSKPLSEQSCPEAPGLTWEQYFLKAALDLFHHTAAMAAAAEEEGYTMSEEEEADYAELTGSLDDEARQYGYTELSAYLRDSFGACVDTDTYLDYLELYVYVLNYENDSYEAITWTDEDLLEYFRNNQDQYQGLTEQPNVSVRHILVEPEDTDGDGTISDAEKAAARTRAEALLAEYEKDPQESTFAGLANEYSTDGGSNNRGGLYADVYPGQMVAAFNDWCFDPDRQPGDTGIVETQFGYHVMYFVAQSENYTWRSVVEQDYPSSRMLVTVRENMEAHPLEVDYESIVLGPIPDLLKPIED